jgi:spermidine synthase
VGRSIGYLQKNGPVSVGVIGLGAGVMAGYCRDGDAFRFYEIDPLAAGIARREFTFLNDCPSAPVVLLGDARLLLEREAPRGFHLLVVDAFSGDSVPVHLLTREAYQTYFKHLRPDGILAINVSNRYLHLIRIVVSNAEELGKNSTWVHDDGDLNDLYLAPGSDWVLVTSNWLEDPVFRGRNTARIRARPDLRPWTDDYSNLLRILR